MIMTRQFRLKKFDTAHFSCGVRKSIQLAQAVDKKKCSCMDGAGG